MAWLRTERECEVDGAASFGRLIATRAREHALLRNSRRPIDLLNTRRRRRREDQVGRQRAERNELAIAAQFPGFRIIVALTAVSIDADQGGDASEHVVNEDIGMPVGVACN